MMDVGGGDAGAPGDAADAGGARQPVNPAVVGAEVAAPQAGIGLLHPAEQFSRCVQIVVSHVLNVRSKPHSSLGPAGAGMRVEELHEPAEEVVGIVGAGGRLGVVLDRKDRE